FCGGAATPRPLPSFPPRRSSDLERSLDDPALKAARAAIDLVLAGHEPWPALAVDRHWTLVASNAAVAPLLEGVDPHLLAPPVNVDRKSTRLNSSHVKISYAVFCL